MKMSISGTNTSSQTFTPFTDGASSMTVCCSESYTSIIHFFSLLVSRILFLSLPHCFPDFMVIGFRL